MRFATLLLVTVGFSGAVLADDEYLQYREHGANDYSAQLVYRLDFASDRVGDQSLGFRVDNERASSRGAPAMFHANVGAQGLDKVAINGLDLRGAALSVNQASGGGYFSTLTTGQWFFIGFAAVLGGFAIAEAADDDDTRTPTGTGGT